MNNNLLIELVKLSNSLDNCGLVKEADWIDGLISSRERLPIKLAAPGVHPLTARVLASLRRAVLGGGKKGIAARVAVYGASGMGLAQLGGYGMGAWGLLSTDEQDILTEAGMKAETLETNDPNAIVNQVIDDMLRKDLVGGINWTKFPSGAGFETKGAFKDAIIAKLYGPDGGITEEELKALITEHSGSDGPATNYEQTEAYAGVFTMIKNVESMRLAFASVGIEQGDSNASEIFGYVIGWNTASGQPCKRSEWKECRKAALAKGLMRPPPTYSNSALWLAHVEDFIAAEEEREKEVEETRELGEEVLGEPEPEQEAEPNAAPPAPDLAAPGASDWDSDW